MSFVDHTAGSYYETEDDLKERLRSDRQKANENARSILHNKSSGNIWLATAGVCEKIWPGNGWPPKGAILYISPATKHEDYTTIADKMGLLVDDEVYPEFTIMVKSNGDGYRGEEDEDIFGFYGEVMVNSTWRMDDDYGYYPRTTRRKPSFFHFDNYSEYKIHYNPQKELAYYTKERTETAKRAMLNDKWADFHPRQEHMPIKSSYPKAYKNHDAYRRRRDMEEDL